MKNCIVCNKEFTPTDRRHKACGNACVVRIYYLRSKAKAKIDQLTKLLKTPEALKMLDRELDTLLVGLTP
ncbi:hypothetical protein QN382_12200 [Pseudomonas sp. 10B1]|uniref:hypothetical protein n=1 Tax=unclassified Pseudomonas TaxID=196821 RepID=UPI002B22B40B|nr:MULTISPECIES: hypothetical protein [unclassified Pseudomonas]MEA9996196.1 hypothetical protein [Pseudomonas sp. AA4]MEB0088918.1 hypothetical protein [Pseudomonas sp. RTI1]MEB0128028.1 hypothetical protein [Pseudomonas sp. CCC1.2]MEB0154920.1 hypothetical protein [Pseudomonas sp. CCC4.3]MEB0219812.1 hypothetical protein [Pseudomonas sp. AB12(2023)]